MTNEVLLATFRLGGIDAVDNLIGSVERRISDTEYYIRELHKDRRKFGGRAGLIREFNAKLRTLKNERGVILVEQ